mmetsp:Transcript_15572/g.31510  ORF Transcript_15572/g.31510 Transcript_15572/m.31510 type:complete len:275 (+) Transcript_15572:109-933(+)
MRLLYQDIRRTLPRFRNGGRELQGIACLAVMTARDFDQWERLDKWTAFLIVPEGADKSRRPFFDLSHTCTVQRFNDENTVLTAVRYFLNYEELSHTLPSTELVLPRFFQRCFLLSEQTHEDPICSHQSILNLRRHCISEHVTDRLNYRRSYRAIMFWGDLPHSVYFADSGYRLFKLGEFVDIRAVSNQSFRQSCGLKGNFTCVLPFHHPTSLLLRRLLVPTTTFILRNLKLGTVLTLKLGPFRATCGERTPFLGTLMNWEVPREVSTEVRICIE